MTEQLPQESESESHSVVSDSLWPHGLYSPWRSPGQNTGGGSLSILQGIFPTQGLNPGLSHCWWILHHLSNQGSSIVKAKLKPLAIAFWLLHEGVASFPWTLVFSSQKRARNSLTLSGLAWIACDRTLSSHRDASHTVSAQKVRAAVVGSTTSTVTVIITQRSRHGSGSLGSRPWGSALHAGGSTGGTPENNTYPRAREAGLSGMDRLNTDVVAKKDTIYPWRVLELGWDLKSWWIQARGLDLFP